jgi:hypothetical protein
MGRIAAHGAPHGPECGVTDRQQHVAGRSQRADHVSSPFEGGRVESVRPFQRT